MGKCIEYLPYFIVAFEKLGELGIGKGRRRFQLHKVTGLNLPNQVVNEIVENEIFCCQNRLVKNVNCTISGSQIQETSGTNIPDQIELHFITPLRLKYQRELVNNIELHILMRNILRRISSILYFHHGDDLNVDYKDLIAEAEKATKIEDNTIWVDWERFSKRQDTKLKMGGLVGRAKFKGDFTNIYPYLKLAEIIHAGKGTVFGLGKYKIV